MNIKRFYVVPIAAILIASGFGIVTPYTASAQEVPNCGPIDLAFLVDVTGSMGPAIANVKAELPNIIADANAASGGDLEVVVWSFRDNVIKDVPDFTTDIVGTITPAINALSASGGGGEPEASDATKRDAVDLLSKDAGDLGIYVLITDARPGGDGRDSPIDVVDEVDLDRMHQAALDAATKNIRMSDVHVPTYELFGGTDAGLPVPDRPWLPANPNIADVLKDNAASSGGIYTRVNADGSGTADAIRAIIRACGGEPVGGEILSVSMVSLFVAGAAANAFWVIPAIGGAAAAAVLGLIKARKQ